MLMALASSASASPGAPIAAAGIHVLSLRGHLATPAAGTNLTYHGGRVMAKQEVSYAIFWEPATLQNGQPATVSATYNSLLTRYFGDVGGKGLYGNNTQYYEKNATLQRNIANKSSFGGSWVDTSAYPASDCTDSVTPGNCIQDKDIRAEVTKAMTTNGWTGGLTHMFFVFTAKGEGSCSGSSCAFTTFCAYHGSFTSSGTVVYANMPYTGTLLGGCGVGTSPNGDIDADSTINVTSHEQMEAVTDPSLNAWYDSTGAENGDKCAWNFGTLDEDGGMANQLWNGHFYILQQEWDNAVTGCVQQGP